MSYLIASYGRWTRKRRPGVEPPLPDVFSRSLRQDGKRVPLRFQGLQADQPHREICDPFLLLLNLSVLLLHLVQQHRI